MNDKNTNSLSFFLIGGALGMVLIVGGSFGLYKLVKKARIQERFDIEGANSTPIVSSKARNTFRFDFEKSSQRFSFEPEEGTQVEISTDKASEGKKSLKVTIPKKGEFPGIAWEVFGRHAQDWSQEDGLFFDVYNAEEGFVSLELKIKSGKQYPKASFSYPIQLEPNKVNHIRMPLVAMKEMLDVRSISYLKIYAPSPTEEITLYFDNFHTKASDKTGDPADSQTALDNRVHFENQSGEVQIFAVSSLDRVFKDGKTLSALVYKGDKIHLSAAKNEYESFQVVVLNGAQDLNQLHVQATDLTHDNGQDVIPAKDLSWRKVGYVPTIRPYYPVKFVGLWPDPLLPVESLNVPPLETQPIWVTLYVPENVQPGMYHGNVGVYQNDKLLKEIPVRLKVFSFTLPKENHLKTAFDFYSHVLDSRYQERNQATLDELADKYIVEMLKYRLNPILGIDPTRDEDLASIDRYRRFGLNNFGIGSKGGRLGNNWPSLDAELESLLPVYRRFGEVLALNKMLEDTYIYTWDEGEIGEPQVAKVARMIKRAHPQLKNMVAYHGFWDPQEHPDWGDAFDIWAFQVSDFDEQKMNVMKQKGIEMWMYISGPSGDGTPNLAIDFDSVDYRIVPWLLWKYDIKGYLYWCVNWWILVDPFKSAANTKWKQNGNGLLFYPGDNGPVASLRLEIIRDGMEDYEYLYLLRTLVDILQKEGLDKDHADLVKQAGELLHIQKPIAHSMRSFTKDAKILVDYRNNVADIIEKLAAILVEWHKAKQSNP